MKPEQQLRHRHSLSSLCTSLSLSPFSSILSHSSLISLSLCPLLCLSVTSASLIILHWLPHEAEFSYRESHQRKRETSLHLQLEKSQEGHRLSYLRIGNTLTWTQCSSTDVMVDPAWTGCNPSGHRSQVLFIRNHKIEWKSIFQQTLSIELSSPLIALFFFFYSVSPLRTLHYLWCLDPCLVIKTISHKCLGFYIFYE